MEPIPKSGLYYPNKIARLALGAIEEVMGKDTRKLVPLVGDDST